MRLLVLLSVLLICSCTEKQPDITYKVSPLKDPFGNTLLKIQLRCKADPSGKTILNFNDTAWGQDSLHNAIHSMRLIDLAGNVIQQRDSNRILIEHDSTLDQVVFEYTLKQDTQGPLETHMTYRPIVTPDYFHVFGHSFFMLPQSADDDPERPLNIAISWDGFPESYAFQNSFDSNKTVQQFKTTPSLFHSSVFVGGDFRLYPIKVNSNQVHLAIRGTWEVFDDSTMVDVLQKTIKAQRDFWKDHSQGYFSVTLIPTVQERGSSFQGTGLTNSFATNASNNEFLEVEGLVYLLNHELMHNWTGHLIKNENEEEQYWFSEGFTEYYTFKNIARNKIYDLDAEYFIEELNKLSRSLYSSPVKNAKNEEINYKNYWSNRDYSKLPYYRGALFAFILDQKIQQDSEGKFSLDDLMLQIKSDALNKDQRLTHSYFINTANTFLKEDLSPFFDSYIIKGESLPIEALFQDFGFDFDPLSNIFDLGFEFSPDRRSIMAVDSSSEAYKAGLRAGDRIVSLSYMYDPTFKAEFVKKQGDQEVSVSFYPKKSVKLPSLKASESTIQKLSF